MLRRVSLMSCCCPSSDVAEIVLRVLEFRFICFSMYRFLLEDIVQPSILRSQFYFLPVNQYPASAWITLIQLFFLNYKTVESFNWPFRCIVKLRTRSFRKHL